MTWIHSTFKKKIEVKSGYTWSGDQELYENREGSTAVLRVSNIQETLELDDILYLVNVSEQHKIEKKISKYWTIAVNSNGNRNRVGKGIFIEEDMEFLFASFLVAFKPFDENEIDPRYFYYWYSSEAIQKRISAIAEGTTGLSNLELRYLKNQEIFHPQSITEQRYIANTINAVDKTIQATKNSIAKLEKLKTSLMQNLLTGKMKPDGTWRTEDEFWIDDKFGKVPNGWKISYLKDVQEINKESLPASTDPNYILKYITIEAVFTDKIDFDKVPEYRFSEAPGRARRIIKKGDFIVSTVRPNLKGFARLKEDGENWICSTGFATVSPKENQVSDFYFFQILSFIGEKQFASFISGSNYPAVTDRDFKQLRVYEPPFEEQVLISDKIESVVNVINKKQASINQLDKLKKSLMQNLLTGKVRVTHEALKKEENEQ
jgi:type I restriction enzyme S subunit